MEAEGGMDANRRIQVVVVPFGGRSNPGILYVIKSHKMSKVHTTNEGNVMRETQQEVQQNNQVAYVSSGVALATILFTCFIAEHNLPFTIVDHLASLMKVMFPALPLPNR